MPRFRPAFLFLVLAATLAFGAGNAAAKTPCWKTLLNDWYDGRIDGTYPVSCYNAAINHLPEDLSDYSQARSDLNRALENALLAMGNNSDEPPPPSDTMVPPPGGGSSSQSHNDKGFFERLANRLGPGNATSIPLPLLILAGVGLLLVAGAGASVAARRIQAKRAQPRPATVPPGPPNRRK